MENVSEPEPGRSAETPATRILAVFMTFRTGLFLWREKGLLDREIALYTHMLESDQIDEIRLFTYDNRDQTVLKETITKPDILARFVLLGPGVNNATTVFRGLAYSLTGPWQHRESLEQAWWIKTNQLNGGWAALIAARLTRRPLLVRFGYLLSLLHASRGSKIKAYLANFLERRLFKAASAIAAPSQLDIDHISTISGVARKTVLTPTYVDLSTFQPKAALDFDSPFVFVGRFEQKKNLHALIRATALVDHPLRLYGSGSLEPELRTLASELGADVQFAGTLANNAIAQKLGEHAIFVLPSHQEGLPKALIEAMASGLVCVATPTHGVCELIIHRDTGYLIDDTSAEAIASALRTALTERDASLGQAARERAILTHDLNNYAAREIGIYAAQPFPDLS